VRRPQIKKLDVETTEALVTQGLQKGRATGVEPAMSSLGITVPPVTKGTAVAVQSPVKGQADGRGL
jgi:hypothetical protein